MKHSGTYDDQIEALTTAVRKVTRHRLSISGTGILSLRLPDKDIFLVTPREVRFEEVSLGEHCIVDSLAG